MKSLALILASLTRRMRRQDNRIVVWLVALFVVLVAVYTTVFHLLMAHEGRQHSWATGVYWTITTMSTLGFGDITFTSDAGRLFSVLVLVTGATFILVLLPFAFIQFVFTPWMDRREAARAPRRLGPDVHGHIILTGVGPIEDALIRRARLSGVPHVVVEPDVQRALRLQDQGYPILVGELDDPRTYEAARIAGAALVAATRPDTTNTNIAFTAREVDPAVPIVATATFEASVDVLELAGCDQVLRLGRMLGRAMAERVLGAEARSRVVGRFGPLLVAEADVADAPFVGRTLREAGLRTRGHVNVVGLWERGEFTLAGPDSVLGPDAILILVGSADQLASYDAAYATDREVEAPVVIVGGGRVGRAAAVLLAAEGVEYRIVEERSERIRDPRTYVLGDAADVEVLEAAGLRDASAVLITTGEDDINVYLTLYCRKLEADVRIISRANHDRNVSTLHRAGADAVLSYATIGATAMWNALHLDDTLVLAEGLDVIRLPVPPSLAGRTLAEAGLRGRFGVNVAAIAVGDRMETNPDPHRPLPPDADLVVIGDAAAEAAFFEACGTRRPPHRWRRGDPRAPEKGIGPRSSEGAPRARADGTRSVGEGAGGAAPPPGEGRTDRTPSA